MVPFTILSVHRAPARTVTAAVPLVLAATPTLTPFRPLPTFTPFTIAIEPPPVVNEDPPDSPEDIRLPYDDYILTQKTHGAASGWHHPGRPGVRVDRRGLLQFDGTLQRHRVSGDGGSRAELTLLHPFNHINIGNFIAHFLVQCTGGRIMSKNV